MKLCLKCNEIKSIAAFGRNKQYADNLHCYCKLCANIKKKKWRESNPEYKSKYYKDSKADYYLRNANKIKEYRKDYYANNPEKVKECNKNWYDNNIERNKIVSRLWVENNRDKVNASRKSFYDRNPTFRADYAKRRYHENINARLRQNIASRLRSAIKVNGGRKKNKTVELIGCSIQELRNHLESLFQDGMSWENQGEWHIDHIRPCISFDLTEIEEQKLCFHFSNLQPLWARDNQIKWAKYERA